MAKEGRFRSLLAAPAGTVFMCDGALMEKGETHGANLPNGPLDCFVRELTPSQVNYKMDLAYFLLRGKADIEDMDEVLDLIILDDDDLVLLANVLADCLPAAQGDRVDSDLPLEV